jgi:hypothetical protein
MKRDREERLSHVKYEYEMATFCINGLSADQTQAVWNVLLAAFAVYFRNSRDFLNGKGDQTSIKASNYVGRFESSSAETLEVELNQLHQQILHLSGKRTSEAEKKFGLEAAKKLMQWLDINMMKFLKELPAEQKTIWNTIGATGPVANPDNLSWSPTTSNAPATSCNHIQVVVSNAPLKKVNATTYVVNSSGGVSNS